MLSLAASNQTKNQREHFRQSMFAENYQLPFDILLCKLFLSKVTKIPASTKNLGA
jgi:hypothetical protein